ncbi:MAG: xylulokinase [Xanthomonadales bacterium]|nr:xylulokinase [Xanthomonadales bacterium]
MSTVLGIDLGTQSVKVVFYDFDARETLAVESAPLDLYQTEDGLAEQQAHWWIIALRQALQQVGRDVRQSVVAIGVSGQQHGFVPIDKAGEVQAPVKLWCDTSTGAECDIIMDAFGGSQACIEEVGNPILPGYTASKVRWFRDSRPGLYAQMDCILLPHDYINFYLTGERCMEAGDASGTGFLDIRTRSWSEKMLAAIDPERDLRDCLPEVRTSNEPIGELLPSIASELSLPPGVPVAIGGGDNMMGAIGTGNVSPGVLTMSLGTSGTVYAFSESPVIDPKGNIAAFCTSTGGWLPLLCTMNCTVSTELMRNLIGTDIAGFEALVAQAPRGANGVITVPFFNGERTPNLPNAKACVLGLDSRNTRPENLFRSAVEGATFALRFGVDELASLGIRAKEIVVTGGGANSAIWRQIVSDVCNAPVTVLEGGEGAAFGAALQAVAMLDQTNTDLKTLVDEHLAHDDERSCEPRPSAVNYYQETYNKYQQAVEKVAALYS